MWVTKAGKGKDSDSEDEEEEQSRPSTTRNTKNSEPMTSKSSSTSGTISCLGVSVPCDDIPPGSEGDECPLLENVEKYKLQEYVSDKDIEKLDPEQFSIRQSIGGFKPDTHYWFIIRNKPNEFEDNGVEPEIRFIAPYATDVVDFFTEHYFIEDIGHSSNLPLDEFVKSYNEENPGKFVLYAGTFLTDNSGKIIKWSNDSGHFAPSIDYAAAIAKALGIMDAMFIPWSPDMEDTEKSSIFYQQYKTYTGPYSAGGDKGKSDGDEEEVDYSQVFYPHDYHTWYKFHGQQNIGNIHSVHTVHGKHVSPDHILMFIFMFIMIGLGIVSMVFYGRRGPKRMVKKIVVDEEDEDV